MVYTVRKILPFSTIYVLLLTVHEVDTDEKGDQRSKMFSCAGSERPEKKLMPVTSSIKLKLLSETLVLVAFSARGIVQVDIFQLFKEK